MSNDAANASTTRRAQGMVSVVPVTSSTERVYPFQVLLPAALTGLPADSKAQVEQVRSISFDRVGSASGRLSAPIMVELDAALRPHLQL